MNSLLNRLLTLRHLEYLILEPDCLIADASARVSRFADGDGALAVGMDLRLGLPELIGAEADLIAIVEGEQESFELKAIARPTPTGSLLYFDLCITALEATTSNSRLICLFEDVTERMMLEQSLVQASNEMSLLLSALESSKNYVDTVINSMADALIITTKTGVIKAINRATQDLLGYDEASLVNQPFACLVADENFLFHEIQLVATQTDTPKDIEIVCRKKTGEKCSLAFSYAAAQTETDLQEFVFIGRDVTERQHTQQRLMAQYTVARLLPDAANLTDAAAKLLPALCHSLEWDMVELWMPETEKLNNIRREVPSPLLSAELLNLSRVESWSKPIAHLREFLRLTQSIPMSTKMGLPGQVWNSRFPKWIPDLANDASFLRTSLATKAGLQSAVGFPIQNGSEVLGVIIFFSCEMKRPDPNLLQAMTVIGSQLGQFIKRKQAEAALHEEQARTEQLLLNVLPEPIVDRLKHHDGTIAEHFSDATVLFADLVGFTPFATRLSPIAVVDLLNQIFSAFDHLTGQYGLEKIKTIGDAYMAVGGLPRRRTDHAQAIAELALDMQTQLTRFNTEHDQSFSMRIGIHSGSVVAGVIGIKKFTYDLWGDTVNIASRMESQGIAGHIQVTAVTYELLRDQYQFEPRGEVAIKGKGEMTTYLLVGRKKQERIL